MTDEHAEAREARGGPRAHSKSVGGRQAHRGLSHLPRCLAQVWGQPGARFLSVQLEPLSLTCLCPLGHVASLSSPLARKPPEAPWYHPCLALLRNLPVLRERGPILSTQQGVQSTVFQGGLDCRARGWASGGQWLRGVGHAVFGGPGRSPAFTFDLLPFIPPRQPESLLKWGSDLTLPCSRLPRPLTPGSSSIPTRPEPLPLRSPPSAAASLAPSRHAPLRALA